VYAIETMKEMLARPALPMSVGIEEHKESRRAAPANLLLRRTLVWLASLPPDILPTALVRRFPRIANLIAATWRDPKSFDAYMESLLTDNRGTRRGFPPDVLAELEALQRCHHALREESSAWDGVSKRK
jgi:hypothetical protein